MEFKISMTEEYEKMLKTGQSNFCKCSLSSGRIYM